MIDVFELSDDEAQRTGFPQHKLVLVFGPVSPQARHVRIEIQRLEPAGEGVKYVTSVIDPFSNLNDDKAVHVMAWEEPDDPMAMMPIGTIAGCWAFDVDCPRQNGAWEYAQSYPLEQEIAIGDSTMVLDSLERGVTGWRLTSHFPNENNRYEDIEELQDKFWKVNAPEDLINSLASHSLLDDFAPPVVRLDLLHGDSRAEVTEIYGPVGPLNNKFYHFFRPAFAELPEKLQITQVIELPLAKPWIYNFDPKVIATPPTKIHAELAPFTVNLKLKVEGLYWEEDIMLIAPLAITDAGSEVDVDLADCLVRNLRTKESYFCLGQTLVDLPQPRSSLKKSQVYGWQYPPIHNYTRQASFEVCTVTITPHKPIDIDLEINN